MDRLSGATEWLDGPLDDPPTLAGNLRDLGRANRWLGGTRLSARAIDLLGPPLPASVLDVGTGGADIPRALLERAARTGRDLRVTGIDSRPEILAAAVSRTPGLAATPGLELQTGDGLALPYPDTTFDVAHCSLVVHHLEPADAVALLREMARVSRLGIVVNDLVRGRHTHVGAWLLAHVTTANRYTRSDAPMSVRRSYTTAELATMLGDAGLTVIGRVRGLFGHRWALAARPVAMDE